MYKNIDIFSIEHPFGKEAVCASGSIINIFNNFEFYHNISTDTGSSGSPIILLNNNPNSIQVIGIHKNRDEKLKLNGGIFIGEIFKEINTDDNTKNNNNKEIEIYKSNPGNTKNFNNGATSKHSSDDFINQNKTKNFIIGEIYITKNEINENIGIINSFENYKRKYHLKDSDEDYKNENEKEIKENIEIKINGKIIEFTYYYKFKNEGKYIVEYSFENNLTKINHMFFDCNSLINLNLSNFNTKNVTNMSYLFGSSVINSNSLTNLNLSNFNT